MLADISAARPARRIVAQSLLQLARQPPCLIDAVGDDQAAAIEQRGGKFGTLGRYCTDRVDMCPALGQRRVKERRARGWKG